MSISQEKLNEIKTACQTILPTGYQTLYSGTKDLKFATQVTTGHGWQGLDAFRAAYCKQKLGKTAVYGPGIYVTDQKEEAAGYGEHLMEFTLEAAMGYIDLSDLQTSKAAVKIAGGGKQNVLGEPNLDVLLRVTGNYFVLRTPLRVTVKMA